MFAPRVDTPSKRSNFNVETPPKTTRIVVNRHDIAMWMAILAHGPLPTHYLDAFTEKSNYVAHQQRLTLLRRGSKENGPFIMRCQIDCADPLLTKYVYMLHLNAERELENRGISNQTSRRGWAVHQLMGSCITASLELMGKPRRINFIPRHTIQADNKKSMSLRLSKSSPRKRLVPDELFGLEYPDHARRYFVCEWDRGSEPFSRKKSKGVDLEDKLTDYIDVMRNGGFKADTITLIVTSSIARANSIKKKLIELDPVLAKRFVINVLDHFKHPWRMPPILIEIYEPWERADGKPFDISVSHV